MTDLPPPPPPGLPLSDPEARKGASNKGNQRKPWIWVAVGIVIVVIAVSVAVVALQRDETTQAAEEHPVGDPTPSPTPTPTPSPTPTPPEITYPETFNWTVPDVIGMTKNEARAVIQESLASAETADIEPVSFWGGLRRTAVHPLERTGIAEAERDRLRYAQI
jgi:hypothetical protein